MAHVYNWEILRLLSIQHVEGLVHGRIVRISDMIVRDRLNIQDNIVTLKRWDSLGWFRKFRISSPWFDILEHDLAIIWLAVVPRWDWALWHSIRRGIEGISFLKLILRLPGSAVLLFEWLVIILHSHKILVLVFWQMLNVVGQQSLNVLLIECIVKRIFVMRLHKYWLMV